MGHQKLELFSHGKELRWKRIRQSHFKLASTLQSSLWLDASSDEQLNIYAVFVRAVFGYDMPTQP